MKQVFQFMRYRSTYSNLILIDIIPRKKENAKKIPFLNEKHQDMSVLRFGINVISPQMGSSWQKITFDNVSKK